MSMGWRASLLACACAAFVSTATAGPRPQSASAGAKPADPSGASSSRTPDGQPDIQGVWAGNQCQRNAPCPPTSLEPIHYLRSHGFPQRQGLVTSRTGAPAATAVTRSEEASAIVDPPAPILP